MDENCPSRGWRVWLKICYYICFGAANIGGIDLVRGSVLGWLATVLPEIGSFPIGLRDYLWDTGLQATMVGGAIENALPLFRSEWHDIESPWPMKYCIPRLIALAYVISRVFKVRWPQCHLWPWKQDDLTWKKGTELQWNQWVYLLTLLQGITTSRHPTCYHLTFGRRLYLS